MARQASRSVGIALRMLLRWSARRVGAGALWLFGVPFLLIGAYFGLFLPATLAVKVTDLALSTRPRIDEIAAVALLMGITVGGLRWAFSQRRLLDSGRGEALLRIAIVLIFAVASFSSLTAVLYQRGALDVSPEGLPEDRIFDKTAELYVWHLADSVPLLDIPQNLEWTEPFEVDRVGGFLLIVFTGVVILPLVPAVRLAAASRGDPYGDDVFRALRKSGRSWTVNARPKTVGRHATVVEEFGSTVVVDPLRDVWTEELALRRLELARLGAAGAYVLVADHVGERARDRIEASFAESSIPARLAAWRGDEYREPLARLVDGLFAELIAYEDAVLAALEATRGWRVDRCERAEEAPRAVVVERDGTRILVDIVRDTRNGGAAAKRFEEVSAADDGHSGYLLVAGLAGLAAQWRLERRFAQSTLPARLAVWSPSEPDAQLAAVIKGFLADVTRAPARAAES